MVSRSDDLKICRVEQGAKQIFFVITFTIAQHDINLRYSSKQFEIIALWSCS